jgi:DHA1 family tetracycline resistance protein-like MFS transporter
MLQQSPSEGHLSFIARINRLKAVLFVTFAVGFITGIPSAVIPGLQSSTYGSNSFQITGGIAAGKGVLAFIYNPVVGSISDLHGRRRCLMVTLTASIVPYLAMTCTSNFWVFAVTDMFFGVYGVSLTLLMALVADLIPAHSGVRTEGFAAALAVFMLAVGGSTFVGMSFSNLTTFTICAASQTAVLILAYFIIPDRKEGSEASTASPSPACADDPDAPLLVSAGQAGVATSKTPPLLVLRSFFSPSSLRLVVDRVLDAIKKHRNLRFLTAIIFWNYLTQETLEQLLLLYLQNTLNLNSNDQAYVISIMSAASLLCLTVIITYMRIYFGTVGTLRLALLANFILSMLYAFATTTWQAMAIPSLSLVGMAVFPCTCAIAAASVSDENSGVVQGIATGARVIAGAICPGLFGLLFQVTQNSQLPGAPFVVGACCVLVALLFSRFVEDVDTPEERAKM